MVPHERAPEARSLLSELLTTAKSPEVMNT